WWGPQDYISPSCEIDLKEGGKFIFCMRAPKEQGGQDSYTAGTYSKIVPLERLEFTQSLADKDGNLVDPVTIGMPEDFPKETQTTVVFKSIKNDTMTELTIIEKGQQPGSQMFLYALLGLYQTMDKLAESVKEQNQ
ncbi:MAG TPA: SRPBCC domain-containing protein, partial [Patescibacteria group bacterium]|nr:SRPBCC domain-containing protein [Patescibacteria group bacterium]